MAAPFVMTIAHQLDRQEARNRLQAGFSQARQALPGLEEQWTGDQMDFRLGAMGQTVTGRIEVFDDSARVEVHLPGVLGWFGGVIGRRISERAKLMLEKK
jgi:Putative polyhydroxyalkanoic acid system protein (PHA_gran_rgn)